MVIGAEQSRGTQPVMILKQRRHRQSVRQQFQHDVTHQTVATFRLLLRRLMRDKTHKFFQILRQHNVPPDSDFSEVDPLPVPTQPVRYSQ